MAQDKETLWIKLSLGAEIGAPVRWSTLDAGGKSVEHGVSPIASLPRDLPCKAVLAADRVWLTQVKQPARRRLRGAALAYALEDRLADAPETVHAVAGVPDDDGIATVAVVDRAWLTSVLAALARAGIEPTSVLAEQAALAAKPDEWRLIWSDPVFLLGGDRSAILIPGEAEACQNLLNVALDNAVERPERIVIHASKSLPAFTAGDTKLVIGAPYDWAEAAHAGAGMELLTGDFSRRRGFEVDAKAWRPALWLALALVAANGLGFLACNGAKAWQTKHLASENRKLFSSVFPETKTVVDPVRQMRGKVADLRHRAGVDSDGDFLPLLTRAGQALPHNVRQAVRTVQYRPGAVVLKLPASMTFPDAWAAAGLRATRRPSSEAGWDELTVEIGS
jgi:general secretion pathway protein L